MVDSGTPVICLTRRWLRRSPRVKRRTSRIFRMTTRARGIDIAPLTWAGDVDGELAEPGYLTPGLRRSLLPGVPGFVRTGARIQSERMRSWPPPALRGAAPSKWGGLRWTTYARRSRARRLPLYMGCTPRDRDRS